MLEEWIIPLITLATLEIVLGIDNLVFLAIVTSRLPEADRPSARRYGIALACITRILLLLSLARIVLAGESNHGNQQRSQRREWRDQR
jgi:predicted tellurium resistance membrane protein TerC